jgi:hypothetical protein
MTDCRLSRLRTRSRARLSPLSATRWQGHFYASSGRSGFRVFRSKASRGMAHRSAILKAPWMRPLAHSRRMCRAVIPSCRAAASASITGLSVFIVSGIHAKRATPSRRRGCRPKLSRRQRSPKKVHPLHHDGAERRGRVVPALRLRGDGPGNGEPAGHERKSVSCDYVSLHGQNEPAVPSACDKTLAECEEMKSP